MKRALWDIIERFAQLAAGGDQRLTVPAEQARQFEGWLRELRARRIAMGRPADDERNAAADMCSCAIGPSGKRWPPVLWGTEKEPFRDGCPMHPEPAEQRAEGCTPWQATWCAVHGDCTCPVEHPCDVTADPACPLHGDDTDHGDAVDPEYQ